MSAGDRRNQLCCSPGNGPDDQKACRAGCGHESLSCLLQRIVDTADAATLGELAGRRTVFSAGSARSLLLPQFLDRLRDRARAGNAPNSLDMADWAYDHTLDKFTNMPSSEKPVGPDCRNYYRAVLRLVDQWRQEHSVADPLVEEAKTAEILQNMVVKHFHLSKLDYYRRPQASARRYVWRAKRGRIVLHCPAHISGHQLRGWLEATFPNADPTVPGECERIERSIEDEFGSLRSISWEESDIEATYRSDTLSPSAVLMQKEEAAESTARAGRLASLVADEKVQRIDRQRPAIRRLGRERLRLLIGRVFSDIADGEYQDSAIARAFGLSKPTFSRFAGSNWSVRLSGPDQLSIPDLWRNLAHIMAQDPEFLAAAARAGVLARLSRTLTAMGERLQGSEDER